MAEETKQTAFRLPVTLLERLDTYARDMETEHPGMSYTRADAVRVLLTRALDEHEERRTPARKRGK
jgi:predicted DNA-binding protein